MNSDKLILDLNYRHTIIDERHDKPFNGKKMFDLLPETIVDKRTLKLIEIYDLFKAVNHTSSRVGAARLFHSLNAPPESLELILAKQEALRELESDDALRSRVEEYIGAYADLEKSLFRFLNFHYQPIAPYRDLRNAMEAIYSLQKMLDDFPSFQSSYLDSLFKLVKNFSNSPAYDLVRGPAFRTIKGLKSKREKGFFTPSLRFRRGRLSGGTIGPALPSIHFAAAGLTGLMNPAMAESLVLLTGGGSILGLLYGALLKPLFDNETAILPLRQRFLESNSFTSTIEAVACIDEILSFYRFRKSISHTTVIPEIHNTERHFFRAKALKNPIAAKDNNNYIPNDVHLDNVGVTFITGPNSGGKTTYCKTVAQSQILAQIGAPIVASSATLNLADYISYQAPSFDSLSDEEGRFGTELRATKEIFFKTTPKSLVFLDEIAEGTTSHERMKLSVSILDGFIAKFNNTLLVTHSYELADNFRQMKKGQFLMVEFANGKPSHRMVEGISRDSHADKVANKIGFSPEDIREHLREHGYI